MDLDFDNALDGLRDTIPTFDFSNFASKDIVPPKAQHILSSVLFGKIVQDMKVDFSVTTRQKAVFGCLKRHMLKTFSSLSPSMGISVKKEAPVNFLTDSQEARLTFHSADVLMFG
ncbi:hypothetical protein L195_g035450 [Trifolium pratense]|uniref:Uncharacterized protein n=1 Tax=Trifolium pratense TaxID=57577 RepID=A0A2K3LLP9_TRIPR|nr:hypothetical protein L195_g035450 [Trifolium pratense]